MTGIKLIDRNLPTITEILKQRKVLFAYVFGSQVDGNIGKLSDIDIGVYLKNPADNFQSRLELMDKLGRLLKKDKIDVVVLNDAESSLVKEIIVNGKLILDRNIIIRLIFERKNLQTREDMNYFQQVFYQALKERIKNNKMGEFYGRKNN